MEYCKSKVTLISSTQYQYEIRELANEVNKILGEVYPKSWEILNDGTGNNT